MSDIGLHPKVLALAPRVHAMEFNRSGSVVLVRPGQDVHVISVDAETRLAQLQGWVGGYIEVAGTWSDEHGEVQAVVNADGRGALPANWLGTAIADRFKCAPDDLVGPVVILFGKACLT